MMTHNKFILNLFVLNKVKIKSTHLYQGLGRVSSVQNIAIAQAASVV
jgi:hypothetical protein